MTWTAPKTWSVDEALTASKLNTHLRDNLNALKTPPGELYTCNEGSDYTTTSTSFVDVDATNLALTITTAGGDVLVGFVGSFDKTTVGAKAVRLDVYVDTARDAGDDGICGFDVELGYVLTTGFVWLIEGLSAGTHTFKLQWKTEAGTARLYAGAGTTDFDVHPQFWVKEIG